MPKSRNRKNHDAKVQSYRKKIEDGKKSFDKKMRDMFAAQQQEHLQKQIDGNSTVGNKLEGLNTDDFVLESVDENVSSV